MKSKKILFLTGLAFTAFLAGCSTPEMRIKKNPTVFASFTPAEQELVKQGRVAIGFTPSMVRIALGNPDRVTRRVDKNGTSEIWHYRSLEDCYFYGGFGGAWGPGLYSRGWGRGYLGSYWGGYYGTPAVYRDYIRAVFTNERLALFEQDT
ncbi:MAG: hypothetical protein LBM92_06175 [Opitutaceae bacterium]|jgi:hypothetical protein|nr:hypothetical protein [Opitutaceae bacterium]